MTDFGKMAEQVDEAVGLIDHSTVITIYDPERFSKLREDQNWVYFRRNASQWMRRKFGKVSIVVFGKDAEVTWPE